MRESTRYILFALAFNREEEKNANKKVKIRHLGWSTETEREN